MEVSFRDLTGLRIAENILYLIVIIRLPSHVDRKPRPENDALMITAKDIFAAILFETTGVIRSEAASRLLRNAKYRSMQRNKVSACSGRAFRPEFCLRDRT